MEREHGNYRVIETDNELVERSAKKQQARFLGFTSMKGQRPFERLRTS